MLKSEGAEMTSFLSWWDGFFVVGFWMLLVLFLGW